MEIKLKKGVLSFLVTGLFVQLILGGCRKPVDQLPEPGNPVTKKLVKVEQGLNSSSFVYNLDGTLHKITSIYDEGSGPEQYTVSFSYNSQKKISETIEDDGSKLKFHYEDDRLKTIDRFNHLGQRFSYSEYTWQGNNVVTLNTYLEDVNNSPGIFILVFKLEYTYYTDGNLKGVSGFARDLIEGVMKPAGKEKFEAYDNKINPFKGLETYLLSTTEITGKHNHTRKLRFNEKEQLVETIETTFTYDEHGYPASSVEKHKPAGLLPFYLNFKFTYQ